MWSAAAFILTCVCACACGTKFGAGWSWSLRDMTDVTCEGEASACFELAALGPSVCVKNPNVRLGGTCWCEHGFYYDRPTFKCLPRLGAECSRCDGQLEPPWTCGNPTPFCDCDKHEGFVYSTELLNCVPKPVDVFDPCSTHTDCDQVQPEPGEPAPVVRCEGGICVCDPSSHFLGSVSLGCIPLARNLTEPCELDEDCVFVRNSRCVEDNEGEEYLSDAGAAAWGKCECLDGYEPTEDDTSCELAEIPTTTEEPLTTQEAMTGEPSTTDWATTTQQSTTEVTTSATEEPSTIEPTPTTTEVPTEEPSTTLPATTEPPMLEPTTEHPTTTETPTEKLTTIESTTDEVPTSLAPTTTTPTTNATTTTTSAPGTIECSATDQFGAPWHAYGGQIARRSCPGRDQGYVTWECDASGSFVGDQPNFRDCTTEWVGALSGDIDAAINNGSLDVGKAAKFYDQIGSQIADALQSAILDPTGNGPKQFFGHEISNILNLTTRLVTGVQAENASRDELEASTEKALNISASLIGFSKPWEQMSTTDRTNTFLQTVQMMETSGFTLAGQVRGHGGPEEGDGYAKSYGESGSPYLLEAGLADPESEGALTFPPRPTSVGRGGEGSSIRLPPGSGGNSSFVALQLDRDFAAANVAGKVFDGGNHVDMDREMNSKMIGFTLGGQGEGTDFGDGEGVEVVHKLEQPSWGFEPKKFRRNLHPGEKAITVGATPNCSYFDPVKKAWSTVGCRLTSDGPYTVTCKCSHLSAFGLLSQSHQYVGKGLAQQLTSVAAPALPALGQLRQLYTAPPALLRWREDFYKFLMLFFIAGQFAMVALIDRHYFNMPSEVCYAVGLGCHLFFLVSFMFLLVLTLDVYLTLDLERVKLRPTLAKWVRKGREWRGTLYVVLGIATPALIVTGTAVTGMLVENSRAYGGGFCWLDGAYIWAFYVPAIIIFVLNCGAILYFKYGINLEGGPEAHIMSTNLLFSGLLALSWFAAFYETTPYLIDSPFLSFVFPVLNGVQGLSLYLVCRRFGGESSATATVVVAPSEGPPPLQGDRTADENGNEGGGVFKSIRQSALGLAALGGSILLKPEEEDADGNAEGGREGHEEREHRQGAGAGVETEAKDGKGARARNSVNKVLSFTTSKFNGESFI